MNNNKNNPEEKPLRRVEDLFNRNYLEKSIYVFLTGLALLMVYFFMQNLDVMKERWQGLVSLLTPFIWGICIAYILMPLFNWLQANLRRLQFMRRHNRICLAISLLITLLLFFSLVGVFFSLVIPEVVNSIVSLFNTLTKSSSYDWLLEYLQTGLQQLKDLGVLNYIEDMSAINGSDGSSLLHYLENPQEYFNKLLSYTTGFLLKAGISAKNIMLAFIVSVYMMIGKETFLAQSRKIIYACTTQDRADHFIDFCRRTNRIFSGFLSGKILDSLIIGVTNVIPFFGPFIGAIPSILLLLIVSPQKALIFAIFVLVLQQFDGNILGPKILGDATGLTAFWVIFAVIVMGGMLGIVGMFIGVPIFATIYMIVKNTVETKLKRKKLPIDTNNYR